MDESGLIYRIDADVSDRVYVPDTDGLRADVLRLVHDAATGGHLGYNKTLRTLKRTYWWPRMRAAVKAYVRGCRACQQSKSSTTKPLGLLHTLPIKRPWESVSMDFMGPFPKSKRGNDFFFFGKGFPRYKVHQSHAFQYIPSNGYEETNQGMFGVGRALLARRIATIH